MIVVEYRGFEIKAAREMSLGGEENLYFYVLRVSDGWFMEDSFTTGVDTEAEYIGYLKGRVDRYIADPRGECSEHADTDACSACRGL